MDKLLLEKLRAFKEELRFALRNRLTYSKVVIGMLRKRPLSEDQLFRAQEMIDESIQLVDVRLTGLIDGFEKI